VYQSEKEMIAMEPMTRARIGGRDEKAM